MGTPKFIQNFLLKREQRVIYRTSGGYLFDNIREDRMNFADLVFLNICDLLTDLTNDVTWVNTSKLKEENNRALFVEFVSFFNAYGKFCLNKLFVDGFVVIAHSELGFSILTPNDYRVTTEGIFMKVVPIKENIKIYVMRSETLMLTSMSDRTILQPFLTLLDNVLNSTNTITARLGALIISSPTQTSQPAPEILTDQEKQAMETATAENYGSLRTQKQFLIFPRPMNNQVVSLSSIDNKMIEKLKTCTLAIADRIKVPANQIALIDALSSKSFANGSEMLVGDFAKYQSFERLLNNTFVQMAKQLGLRVDYTIYNKPVHTVESPNII